jgi:hypothetical protein
MLNLHACSPIILFAKRRPIEALFRSDLPCVAAAHFRQAQARPRVASRSLTGRASLSTETSQQADCCRLGEFGETNTIGGHPGEVEAVQSASTFRKKGRARQYGWGWPLPLGVRAPHAPSFRLGLEPIAGRAWPRRTMPLETQMSWRETIRLMLLAMVIAALGTAAIKMLVELLS